MSTRNWNLKVMATDEHPEATLEGVAQEDAARILRGLIHGPASPDYAHVWAAVRVADDDRAERSLVA